MENKTISLKSCHTYQDSSDHVCETHPFHSSLKTVHKPYKDLHKIWESNFYQAYIGSFSKTQCTLLNSKIHTHICLNMSMYRYILHIPVCMHCSNIYCHQERSEHTDALNKWDSRGPRKMMLNDYWGIFSQKFYNLT